MEKALKTKRRDKNQKNDVNFSGLGKTIGRNFSAWLLLLPSVVLLFMVMWQPIIKGIVLSFFHMKGYDAVGFAGFQNYKDVISDTLFFETLKNTFSYVFWSLLIGIIPPIIVAAMLNELKYAKSIFKFAIYFPSMVPVIATALVWYFLFQPGENGVLNMIMGQMGIPASQWLQNPNMTIPLICLTMTWKGFGGTAILYLASMQGINTELYEAATIDGSGIFRKFWHVTLPQISGVALLMLVRQIIAVFQVMVEPMAMTGGGPNNASITLSLQAYQYAFRNFQVDKSLALGVITFLILMVLTVFYFKLKNKVEDN
ncbi:MAG: sugar ABC transporter permease [Oscillospiraceae bacterium]